MVLCGGMLEESEFPKTKPHEYRIFLWGTWKIKRQDIVAYMKEAARNKAMWSSVQESKYKDKISRVQAHCLHKGFTKCVMVLVLAKVEHTL